MERTIKKFVLEDGWERVVAFFQVSGVLTADPLIFLISTYVRLNPALMYSQYWIFPRSVKKWCGNSWKVIGILSNADTKIFHIHFLFLQHLHSMVPDLQKKRCFTLIRTIILPRIRTIEFVRRGRWENNLKYFAEFLCLAVGSFKSCISSEKHNFSVYWVLLA